MLGLDVHAHPVPHPGTDGQQLGSEVEEAADGDTDLEQAGVDLVLSLGGSGRQELRPAEEGIDVEDRPIFALDCVAPKEAEQDGEGVSGLALCQALDAEAGAYAHME